MKTQEIDTYQPETDTTTQMEQLGASPMLIETYLGLADALSAPPKVGTAAVAGFDLGPGDNLAAGSLVVGVAIGSGMDGAEQSSAPGESALRLYVSEEVTPASVAEFVGAAFKINAKRGRSKRGRSVLLTQIRHRSKTKACLRIVY